MMHFQGKMVYFFPQKRGVRSESVNAHSYLWRTEKTSTRGKMLKKY